MPRRQMEVPMELRITVPMAGAIAELFPPESPISHYVLDRSFGRFQLREFDPRRLDPNAGKIKRVRGPDRGGTPGSSQRRPASPSPHRPVEGSRRVPAPGAEWSADKSSRRTPIRRILDRGRWHSRTAIAGWALRSRADDGTTGVCRTCQARGRRRTARRRHCEGSCRSNGETCARRAGRQLQRKHGLPRHAS